MTRYVLVAITYGGHVSSSYYDSLDACENAKSIALTGLTKAEREVEHQLFERRLAWNKEHPFRDPQTDDERLAIEWTRRTWSTPVLGSREKPFSALAFGKIQDEMPEMWGRYLSDSPGMGIESDVIKTAVCFQDVGDRLE